MLSSGKTYKLIFLQLFMLWVCITDIYAQGCSDAGICTLENIKPGMNGIASQLIGGIGYGNADHGIRVLSPYVSYSRKMNKLTLEGRLTAMYQSGSEVSVFGLADVYILANYELANNLRGSLGFKVPLTEGNRKLDGLSLPMDYQSSLGTLDLLLGIHYKISKLEIALAYQQPVTQNKNGFLVGEYPPGSEFNKFQSTNKYVRNSDMLVRLSYPIAIGHSFTLTPSLLPIYHLGNDQFTNSQSQQQEIMGSKGLTLNVNLYADMPIGDKGNLQFTLATPLVVREARPDGLTRHFVINLEYQIRF